MAQYPKGLLNSPSLTDLQLSGSNLNLTGITFGPHASSKLKHLNLDRNSLRGSLPKGLSVLTRLETLSLANNELTGPIPRWLGALKGLKSVDISGNQLSGSLPGSVFRASLALNVVNNELSGNIPASGLALVLQLLKTAVKQRSPGSGQLSLGGNYLTGPCFSSSIASVKCPKSGATPCSRVGSNVLNALAGNCLQNCKKAAFGPPLRSAAVPSAPDSAAPTSPTGPATAMAPRDLKGPRRTPTCTCRKGFVAPASKPRPLLEHPSERKAPLDSLLKREIGGLCDEFLYHNSIPWYCIPHYCTVLDRTGITLVDLMYVHWFPHMFRI